MIIHLLFVIPFFTLGLPLFIALLQALACSCLFFAPLLAVVAFALSLCTNFGPECREILPVPLRNSSLFEVFDINDTVQYFMPWA